MKLQDSHNQFQVQSVKTAVILAGGAALRLRPLTGDIPKTMIVVAGKPLLEWSSIG
jgi:choline kinase